jgi:hypothetical protein
MNTSQLLQTSIRRWIIFFMLALAVSGITAFALETELNWVVSWWPEQRSSFYHWLSTCSNAIAFANEHYPFLAYGYDWLAFAHLVIAVAFIGPLVDPVKNVWILQFGMIACIMVIPLAIVAGDVRQIPVYWRLIDCSFGILGIIPLIICYRKTRLLEKIKNSPTNKL